MIAKCHLRRVAVVFLGLLTIMSLLGFEDVSIVYAAEEGNHLSPPTVDPGPEGSGHTVKGRFLFRTPDGSLEPIREAYVEVKDSERWRVDEMVASGYTDQDGYYIFSGLNNDDGRLQDGRDIYVQVYAENWAVDVVDNPQWAQFPTWEDPTYSFKTITESDLEDDRIVDMKEVVAPEDPGAYNILNTVTLGWYFLWSELGIDAPEVKAFFKDTFTIQRSYYYGGIVPDPFDLGGLHIQNYYKDDSGNVYQDQWDEGTILHEYGHFVMDKCADFWTPFSDVDHSYTSPSGRFPLETAWVEGWAHFFSAAARHWAGYPVSDYRDNPLIEDNYEGDNLEAAVAGILWDIYDSENEPGDTFPGAYMSYNSGFNIIWDVLVNYDPAPGSGDSTVQVLTYPITELAGIDIGTGFMVPGNENEWPIGKDHPWDIYDFFWGCHSRHPEHTSKVWRIFDLHGIQIPDNNPPNNPTSYESTHTPSVPSWGSRIKISWSGYFDDFSGVAGYSAIWDNSPSTFPPESLNLPQRDVTPVDGMLWGGTVSPSLTEGPPWYFHLRTVDYAGNWAPDALHAGPFYVKIESPDDDVTGPSFSNPTSEIFYNPLTARYTLRLSIDITDPSGISSVTFITSFEEEPALFWRRLGVLPTGSSGNTYRYDIPADTLLPYIGQTMYFGANAEDNDDEGWEDKASAHSDIYSVQLTIAIRRPVAFFTQSPDPAQIGQTVTLDASGSFDPDGSIVLYEWDLDNDGRFDDATGMVVITYAYAYPAGRPYHVGLRVTDNDGLTDTATDTIMVIRVMPTITLPPLQATAALAPQTATQGEIVTLSAIVKDDAETPIVGATVTATIGDLEVLVLLSDQGDGNYQGTIDTSNIREGTYEVVVIAEKDGYESATDTVVITVNPTEAFPMWVVAIVGIVAAGIVIAALIFWRRRKRS